MHCSELIIITMVHRRLYEQERTELTDALHKVVCVNYRIIGVISKYKTESKITKSQRMPSVFWELSGASGQELVDNKAFKAGMG